MSNDQGENDSSRQQYEAAYLAHYTTQDLNRALELYRSILSTYPDSQEADYSITQVLNIINSVIPKHRFLDAQVELLVNHFTSNRSSDMTQGQLEGQTDE